MKTPIVHDLGRKSSTPIGFDVVSNRGAGFQPAMHNGRLEGLPHGFETAC
jgi:hypothetical protein